MRERRGLLSQVGGSRSCSLTLLPQRAETEGPRCTGLQGTMRLIRSGFYGREHTIFAALVAFTVQRIMRRERYQLCEGESYG